MRAKIALILILLSGCGIQNESAKNISRRARSKAEEAIQRVDMLEERLSKLQTRIDTMERLSNDDQQHRNLYLTKLGEVESEIQSLREMFKESKIK